jgi:hypothetical protein
VSKYLRDYNAGADDRAKQYVASDKWITIVPSEKEEALREYLHLAAPLVS